MYYVISSFMLPVFVPYSLPIAQSACRRLEHFIIKLCWAMNKAYKSATQQSLILILYPTSKEILSKRITYCHQPICHNLNHWFWTIGLV